MFYWDKSSSGFELESQLQAVSNVKKIIVATAYLSIEGVEILQRLVDRNSVKRKNITVYLSEDFSDDHPSELLTKLNNIAQVRIAKSGRLFHPKLYYIKGETDSLLIFGSSNLTGGGFGKNIEFDTICTPTEAERAEVDRFIQYCDNQTVEVTDKYIEFYKSKEDELAELKKIKAEITKQLRSFDKREDPFTEDTYDLDGFYFSFADYETFFPRNSQSNSDAVVAQRKIVQTKLLSIHAIIEAQVNEMNLYAHWDKSNTTSLTYPSPFNLYKVDWLGLRYGKHKSEVKLGGGIKEPYESFTKHACLQFDVYENGLEIALFFAVRDEAWDRQQLKGNIYTISDKINEQAKAMRGHGFVWKIDDSPSFDFDTADDLAGYLKQYDRDGKCSLLTMHFEPNDPRIKTLPNIRREVLAGFKLLKPLYDIIVWRAPKYRK